MRLLVVDDSKVIRAVLKRGLEADDRVRAVDVAADAFEARERIVAVRPDAVVLDLEMPGVSGLHLLEKLKEHFPVPVIVFSALPGDADRLRRRALELGAAAVVRKPGAGQAQAAVTQLVDSASEAVGAVQLRGGLAPELRRKRRRWRGQPGPKIIAVGSSTGGPEALDRVVAGLPLGLPPIVLTQHMPTKYLEAMALRLNQLAACDVALATNLEELRSGQIRIAPGDRHLIVKRRSTRFFAELSDAPRVNFQKPAVDVMFESVDRAVGGNALAVILTGMGSDGAREMAAMHRSGAYTIGQNEATCAVYGMPREAARRGALDEEIALDDVAQTIVDVVGTALDCASTPQTRRGADG